MFTANYLYCLLLRSYIKKCFTSAWCEICIHVSTRVRRPSGAEQPKLQIYDCMRRSKMRKSTCGHHVTCLTAMTNSLVLLANNKKSIDMRHRSKVLTHACEYNLIFDAHRTCVIDMPDAVFYANSYHVKRNKVKQQIDVSDSYKVFRGHNFKKI